jgi:hypothetical protein
MALKLPPCKIFSYVDDIIFTGPYVAGSNPTNIKAILKSWIYSSSITFTLDVEAKANYTKIKTTRIMHFRLGSAFQFNQRLRAHYVNIMRVQSQPIKRQREIKN